MARWLDDLFARTRGAVSFARRACLLIVVSAMAHADQAVPWIGIKDAITRAETYVAEKQIKLDGYQIRSAIYEPEEREHWFIMWDKPDGGIGSHYSVLIYRDGTILGFRGG